MRQSSNALKCFPAQVASLSPLADEGELLRLSTRSDPTRFQEWMHALGALAWLCRQAPLQQRYPLGFLRSRVFPSFWHQQYRVYLAADGRPLAFVNWAWLSEEIASLYRTGNYILKAGDWRSGPQLWIAEMIAPNGAAGLVIQDLQRQVFTQGGLAQWLKVDATGKLQAVDQAYFPARATVHLSLGATPQGQKHADH